jgi:hypothetical protein
MNRQKVFFLPVPGASIVEGRVSTSYQQILPAKNIIINTKEGISIGMTRTENEI